MSGNGGEGRCTAWIVAEPESAAVCIWGLTPVERLRRALRAAGVPVQDIYSGPPEVTLPQGEQTPLLVCRSDYVFDERLVRALVTSAATALATPDGTDVVAMHVPAAQVPTVIPLLRHGMPWLSLAPRIGLRLVSPADLVPAYTAALRKADPPYLLPVRRAEVVEIENRIFQAAYKGVTDLVTKWIWPRPARAVTRCLARARIHPNIVTVTSWILVIAVAVLFGMSWFGVGLVTAWLMTFLDTVDGKLARVTLTSSRIGHVLDHGLDILHPPFWYLAWAMGLPAHAVWLVPATLLTVGGYIVGRLLEGLFLLLFKIEIHSWRPIDSAFRTVTARRNPNLFLLTVGTLAGRPDVGLVLVALWTACSIGFHTVRLLQALAQRWRGIPVTTWQEARTVA